jgi:glycolate oxidase subunit GlcD
MDEGISTALARDLARVVGSEGVRHRPEERIAYESDAIMTARALPSAVVFPRTADEVARVVRILSNAGRPFVARGAGTGLSGGAVACRGAVLIELARLDRIRMIDAPNRRAVVETGVVNLEVSRAVEAYGLQYAPDPSSQPACTIGGNVAENAGGPHCLKYGVTTQHVLALEVVLPDGEMVDLERDGRGYDLGGLFIGSEGTFGIATAATVLLTPLPEAVETLLADFMEVEAACRAVSEVIADGILPAALEMMDGAAVRAVEASVNAAGYPADAAAVLLLELDGPAAGIAEEAARAERICRGRGAREVRRANDPERRRRLWAGRKGAFGAMGRVSPDLLVQDAVVPRTKLPEILSGIYRIAERYQLRLCNVFHAGDGNLHPNISFDRRDADEVARVKRGSKEIMHLCVAAGGSITGEHGVGIDKVDYMPLLFSEADLSLMRRVRAAWDPRGLANPMKVLPEVREGGASDEGARLGASSAGAGSPAGPR